jgi:hypothetical protein
VRRSEPLMSLAFNSSFLSVDGMTYHAIWKLKKQSIEWYIIRIDCIYFLGYKLILNCHFRQKNSIYRCAMCYKNSMPMS